MLCAAAGVTQTLQYTDYVDPFYRLALLSYRSKLQNMEVVKVGCGLTQIRVCWAVW
jgi:hypothetical protein